MNNRANGCADKACALVKPIPANRLTNKGGKERTGNPKHSRQDEA
jgi:hypothetical protein